MKWTRRMKPAASPVGVMVAPAVAAVGIGDGAYRLFQQFNGPDRSRGDGERKSTKDDKP